MLVSVWDLIEFRLALRKGYKIVETYEIWQYPKTRSDIFIKTKLESSVYQAGVITEEQKDLYTMKIFSNDEIVIAKDAITLNPSLRSISKLAMNSLCTYMLFFFLRLSDIYNKDNNINNSFFSILGGKFV